MGTTANYSWPTPVATDLVKDGWEAIKDLGDAADTTVKAVSDAQGLVHINTTTFSGVTSFSVNDVFSTTYDNYGIWLDATSTNYETLTMRMRASGTDNSSSNYRWVIGYVNYSGAAGFNGINSAGLATSFTIGVSSSIGGGAWLYLKEPFRNDRRTAFAAEITSSYDSDMGIGRGGNMSVNTSYTGFTILAPNNISGTCSVYGFRK